MQISSKMMDRLFQLITLVIFIGITAALISIIKSGDLPFISDKEAYAYNYAYTDESAE